MPEINNLTFEAEVRGPPVGEALNVTFRSNDVKALNGMLGKVMGDLSSTKGVRDLQVNDVLGEQEVKVLIDYEKADQLGLSVNDIGSSIRTALSGTMASQVVLNNKEVDLNVRYQDKFRKDETDISDIDVMDARGNLVPVSTVAKTELTNGQYEIKRYDFKRSKTLTAGVDDDIITSQALNTKVQTLFEKYHSEFPDVSMVYGGRAESTKESLQSLGQAGILALLGIFGLLVFLFGSYLRPVIIMSTIPLGLIGFSVAFFFHDRPVSFMALIGIIGLAGIIVNSGIVLISFIEQLRAEGKMELNEILVKASGMRLRAVLVTSLTTISGLLPTAYGIGGSDSMLVPMTLAMAWGLTSGTVLTLIWVPCAYALLEDWNRFLRRLPLLNRFATSADEEVDSVAANMGGALMKDLSTKEKILKVAHRLFGQKGFDSVSVREISKAADVNISAINYHFENKENLFQATILSTTNRMRDTVKSLYEESENCRTVDLALSLYDYFVKNSESLKLSFKMFMMDTHLFPHEAIGDEDFIGPPGGRFIFDCIKSEKPAAKKEDIVWAVRTIFTVVIHKALASCSVCVQKKQELGHPVGPKEFRQEIERTVKVVLADL